MWAPAAAFNGHRFYIEATGDEGGNAMYRWTPEARWTPPSGGGTTVSTTAATAGAAAAAVFGAMNAVMLGFFIFRAVRGSGVGGIPAASAGDAYAQLDLA